MNGVATAGPEGTGFAVPITAGALAVDGRTNARKRDRARTAALTAHASSTTTPSRMVTRRSICAAMSRLCVATMAASPEARTN